MEKFKKKLDPFIKNIEKILEDNGGEWMVGAEFTWADLYVAYTLDQVILKAICPHNILNITHDCSTSGALLA